MHKLLLQNIVFSATYTTEIPTPDSEFDRAPVTKDRQFGHRLAELFQVLESARQRSVLGGVFCLISFKEVSKLNSQKNW